MITIVDYGLGNLASIANMIKKVGGTSVITSDLNEISKAKKIIIPGVGHFKVGMENIVKKGLLDVLNIKALDEKIPVLGICLGMQLLTSHSEEGDVNGLGWINAQTVKFNFSNINVALKIPHMGWNTIQIFNDPHGVFQNLTSHEARFYFVHSYYVKVNNFNNILCNSNYGFDFTCGIIENNIIGVQFHPEKSHKYGMQLMKNFIAL